jgi:hypothetical protein
VLAGVSLLLTVGEFTLRGVGFKYPPHDERVAVWNKTEDEAMRAGTSLYRFDRDELWSPRPGAHLPWTRDERINAAGYRGPLAPKQREPGVMRIVTLGSCAGFGRGVAYESTYPAALARKLRERGMRAEVLSGGVENSTIVQGLARYRHLFRDFRPDLVVSSYCGFKEQDPAPRCQSDAQRLASGYPLCCHRDHSRWSDWPRRNLRLVQLPIWALRVIEGSYWREQAMEYEDRRMATQVGSYEAPLVRRVSPNEFDDALGELDRDVRADGGHLMMLSIPHLLPEKGFTPVADLYGMQLCEASTRSGVSLVSGRDAFTNAINTGMSLADLYTTDGYPSECGHELLALALADEIVRRRAEYLR